MLIVIQLFALRQLAYSRALIYFVSADKARQASQKLHLGLLNWEAVKYHEASELDSFREFTLKQCGHGKNLEIAICLSNFFAQAFPQGDPAIEFFSPNYNPAEDLKAHSEGAPGHCTTRSALVATSLLSIGVPARVVQLIPADIRGGHNAVEVWNGIDNWIYVDPTHGIYFQDASMLQALDKPNEAKLVLIDLPKKVDASGRVGFYRSRSGFLHVDTNLVYPEPWLYTRIGHRLAFWPFRGVFVIEGPLRLDVGILQWTFWLGIGVCLMGLIVMFLRKLF
ncbi:MAG: transglutaminase domain-containing protein [Deltaproteobacteria bacterium]|nr:transglutaminase domain-containing protein [Deltaproteobacteria bacterium]